MDITKALNQEGVAIVDVREPLEFMFGHAKGAINIPLRSIPNRIDEFKAFSGPIIAYCQSGNRSGQAVNFLKGQGFKEVHNGGGLRDMKKIMNK